MARRNKLGWHAQVPYEFLNKYEKASLRQRAYTYAGHNKRVRDFRCPNPKCRTDRVDDLIWLRHGFGECRQCGTRIIIKENKKKVTYHLEEEGYEGTV